MARATPRGTEKRWRTNDYGSRLMHLREAQFSSSLDEEGTRRQAGPRTRLLGGASDALGSTSRLRPGTSGSIRGGQGDISSNSNYVWSTSHDQRLALLPVRLCAVPPTQGRALGHGVLWTGHLPGHSAGRQKTVHLNDFDRSSERAWHVGEH